MTLGKHSFALGQVVLVDPDEFPLVGERRGLAFASNKDWLRPPGDPGGSYPAERNNVLETRFRQRVAAHATIVYIEENRRSTAAGDRNAYALDASNLGFGRWLNDIRRIFLGDPLDPDHFDTTFASFTYDYHYWREMVDATFGRAGLVEPHIRHWATFGPQQYLEIGPTLASALPVEFHTSPIDLAPEDYLPHPRNRPLQTMSSTTTFGGTSFTQARLHIVGGPPPDIEQEVTRLFDTLDGPGLTETRRRRNEDPDTDWRFGMWLRFLDPPPVQAGTNPSEVIQQLLDAIDARIAEDVDAWPLLRMTEPLEDTFPIIGNPYPRGGRIGKSFWITFAEVQGHVSLRAR